MKTTAFLHGLPINGQLSSSFVQHNICVNDHNSRLFRPSSHAKFSACQEASPNASEAGLPITWENLKEKQLSWAEVPFNSLQEELDAVDEYQQEEEIEDDASWPKFLRAAAYEHWGQPKLALAQFNLVDSGRGLGLIPDFWLRKAYNAFKVGNIVDANKYQDEAERVSIDAVGNQLHFSFWFDEHFKNYIPKHNGPAFMLQHGICKYCIGSPKKARECIAPYVVTHDGDLRELQHAALWYLAASSRWHMNDNLKTEPRDMDLARPYLTDPNLASELVPIAPLFLNSPSADDITTAEASVKEDGLDTDVAMIRAIYLALYYDAYKDDKEAREKWTDVALNAPRGTNANDINDFLYHLAKNRFGSAENFSD